VQNSDGTWSQILPADPSTDPYKGLPSAKAAEECGLPFGASAAYRCLQCRVPAANPLLRHDSSAAGPGMKATVTVSLAFASEAFQVSTSFDFDLPLFVVLVAFIYLHNSVTIAQLLRED
jgi:hypothetical protein